MQSAAVVAAVVLLANQPIRERASIRKPIIDIGGALGLALGLNILDLLMFSGSFAKTFIQKIRMAIGYIRRSTRGINRSSPKENS